MDVWKDACDTCNQTKYKMAEEKTSAMLEIKRVFSFIQLYVMTVIIII